MWNKIKNNTRRFNWQLGNCSTSFKEHFCQPLMHPVCSTLQQGTCRHSYVFTSITSPPLSLQVPASVVWGSELTLSNWLIILRSGLSGNTTVYIPCQINTNKSSPSWILTKHGSYIVSLKTFIHSQFQCYMWYDFRIRAGCLQSLDWIWNGTVEWKMESNDHCT